MGLGTGSKRYKKNIQLCVRDLANLLAFQPALLTVLTSLPADQGGLCPIPDPRNRIISLDPDQIVRIQI